MEDLMQIDNAHYDNRIGLPKDDTYLEMDLPAYLQISLDNMKESWKIIDAGENVYIGIFVGAN